MIKLPKEISTPKKFNGNLKNIEKWVFEICYYLAKKLKLSHQECLTSLQSISIEDIIKTKAELLKQGQKKFLNETKKIYQEWKKKIDNGQNVIKGEIDETIIEEIAGSEKIDKLVDDELKKKVKINLEEN